MNAEQIISIHQEVIVEKLLKLAKTAYEKYLFYSEEMQHVSIESNEYWKAVSKIELSRFEFNDYMKQLKFLDELTHWSENLEEERYGFAKDYKKVLQNYKGVK